CIHGCNGRCSVVIFCPPRPTYLRENQMDMDKVAAFINLDQDRETDARLAVLQSNLPSAKVSNKAYGKGDHPRAGPHTISEKYKAIARTLRDSSTRVYFASCWPSLQALHDEGLTTVFAGLVTDNASLTNSTGIHAFSIKKLCPNWPA